jgi:hypothetical protein
MMDENTSFNENKRQTINPVVDEINKQTEPLLKAAMLEFGYTIPLSLRLYNQIRFYEEYGKLSVGFSIASKSTLAEQFDVTVQQIEDAYHNLGSVKKLGRWVQHEDKVYRNVTRTWASNIRLNKNKEVLRDNTQVLRDNGKSVTAEHLGQQIDDGVNFDVQSNYKVIDDLQVNHIGKPMRKFGDKKIQGIKSALDKSRITYPAGVSTLGKINALLKVAGDYPTLISVIEKSAQIRGKKTSDGISAPMVSSINDLLDKYHKVVACSIHIKRDWTPEDPEMRGGL